MEQIQMEKEYHRIIVIDAFTGEKLKLTVHWEDGIIEWMEKFRLILKFLTFGDETIKDYLPTEDDMNEEK